MKIWPEKPHFFKPIIPGFSDGIRIPMSFFKHLGGKGYPQALLRRGGKEWRVKISDQFLREGWSRFAKDNNLEPGDVVVFGHEGNMVFDVLIFDRSQCEKEDSACEDDGGKFAADPTEAKESPSSKFMSEGSKERVSTPKVKTECSSLHEESNNPHFISTIKRYSINGSFLCLPVQFTRSNGLMNRRCVVNLRDQQGRSWFLDLKPKDSVVCIRRRSLLNEFFDANGFKEGDSFKFELVENRETPVVHILHNFTDDPVVPETKLEPQAPSAVKTNRHDNEKGVNTSLGPDDLPYFTSTIRSYSMTQPYLYLPWQFARSNGLLKKHKLILLDKRQMSWPARLKDNGGHFLIQSGWRKFRDANGLKEGDVYKFELIKNGKVPRALITVVSSSVRSPVDSKRRTSTRRYVSSSVRSPVGSKRRASTRRFS